MLRTFVLAGLFTAAALSPTSAYEVRDPGSIAYGEGGYVSIRVDANMLSRSGCGQVVSSRRGAPDGVRAAYDSVPATVTIDMDANYQGAPKVVRSMFPMSGIPNVSLVHIYFVSTTGRILKSERVSILLY
jgi:hypothetical protein